MVPPILAYSPAGLDLGRTNGWTTFLFTTSRACNLSCEGCWTAATASTIREQLKTGADWLVDDRYGVNVLDALLAVFSRQGGRLVACMSDGEPLVAANWPFCLALAEACGRHGLGFLLFSNGVLLTGSALKRLESACQGRLSVCVSIQSARAERYGDFMLSAVSGVQNGSAVFHRFLQNMPFWKEFNARVRRRTGNHGFGFHTYILPGKTTRDDLLSIQNLSVQLGGVPWVVSSMGQHVLDSLSGHGSFSDRTASELAAEFDTGPTAILAAGPEKKEKVCAYISHGNYSLTGSGGGYGLTLNPWSGGQIQACPYHSRIGTKDWFSLQSYLDALVAANAPLSADHVALWMDAALAMQTRITRAAFDRVGYEACLMRHSKKVELDRFIMRVNARMLGEARVNPVIPLDSADYLKQIRSRLDRILLEPLSEQPIRFRAF